MPNSSPGAYSIRRRLVGAVLGATGIVLIVLGVAVQVAIERSSAREFDERLAQHGRIVLAYAAHEFLETGTVVPESPLPAGEKRTTDVVYQVWTPEGIAVHRSAGAPSAPLVDLKSRGFLDVRIEGTDWRVYALQSPGQPLLVQMAELRSDRNLIAARVRSAVRTPVLVCLPLLAVLVWWLTTAALRPVERLALEIGSRTAGDLSPLDLGHMPEEITALGAALNALIKRQGEALVREQRFTADAAHELRTPLAAIRAQAQVAQRAVEAPERAHALRQLIAGVDRSTRLITQLLSLARVEPSLSVADASARSVSQVVNAVMLDLAGEAASQDLRLDLLPCALETRVPEEPVYLLLRNILDNAIRHSPFSGNIRIRVEQMDGMLEICVTDQGPGIAPEQREAVFDRFRRFSDGYAGSGLGLSIVQRVVDLMGGTIALTDAEPPPGLCVTVRLPTPGHGAISPA